MKLDEFAESFRQEVLSRCNDEETGHFREDTRMVRAHHADPNHANA